MYTGLCWRQRCLVLQKMKYQLCEALLSACPQFVSHYRLCEGILPDGSKVCVLCYCFPYWWLGHLDSCKGGYILSSFHSNRQYKQGCIEWMKYKSNVGVLAQTVTDNSRVGRE